MKARQLPSGAWNVRIMIEGQSYSFTNHDKKTALHIASEFADNHREKLRNPTLIDALEDYTNEREKTLSPSTIRGYRGIIKKVKERNPSIAQKKVIALTNKDIFNIVRPLRTLKTKRNYLNFIQAGTGRKFNIDLIGTASKEIAVPSDIEVKGLLKIFHDTEMEIPVMLGAFGGLRRGEICALTPQDIDGNYVNITKSMVKAPDGSWLIKAPKTPKSVRRVLLPQFVIDAINAHGYITDLLPCNISDRFRKTQLRLGIEHPYCFHSLRHYSASYLHAIGIPDAYIMERGGWSTPHVMQKVYRHALADRVDPMALKAVSAFQNSFQPN